MRASPRARVSRICRGLDEVVEKFLNRPLDGGPYAYLWLDALTQKVREDGRIVNVSVVVGTAVNAEGKREIVGLDVGTSENGAFWLSFLRSLVARGLAGVELVISDASSRASGRHSHSVRRRELAAMPHALHDQLVDACPEEGTAVGGDDGAQHLPAAVSSGSAHPAREGSRAACRALPSGRLDAGRGRSGHPGVHTLPDGALEEDLVEQSAGEVEQRDKAQDRCCGHLPEQTGGDAAGWRSSRRTER